jgi:sulfite reductase (NADPH) flavoprotein alpha-component
MPAPLPLVAQAAAAPVPQRDVLILWASQTGNAQDAAERCAETLSAQAIAARHLPMEEVAPATLAEASHVLVLASTFGDGDPPDNGASFWQALAREDAPRLDHLSFAVLAFGDSSYDQFCGFGRKMDARLEALGARRLVDRVDCEPDHDGADLAWINSVIPVLAAPALPASALPAEPAQPVAAPRLPQSPATTARTR